MEWGVSRPLKNITNMYFAPLNLIPSHDLTPLNFVIRHVTLLTTFDDLRKTNAMPAPTSSPGLLSPIPALYLYPLNDSFVPKHISLQSRVKIGRQTNAKTTPGERNGYFDSKVLSRQHAEVWEENGKVHTLSSTRYAATDLVADLH